MTLKLSQQQRYCLSRFDLEAYVLQQLIADWVDKDRSASNLQALPDQISQPEQLPQPPPQSKGLKPSPIQEGFSTNQNNNQQTTTSQAALVEPDQLQKKPTSKQAATIKQPVQSQAVSMMVILNLAAVEELKFGQQLLRDLWALLGLDRHSIQVYNTAQSSVAELAKQVIERLQQPYVLVLPQSKSIATEFELALKADTDKQQLKRDAYYVLPSLDTLISDANTKQKLMDRLLMLLNNAHPPHASG